MPTPKKPVTVKPADAPRVFELFAKNLDEIRRWYSTASPVGTEIPQARLAEIIIGNIGTALALAAEGKAWQPPY